MKLLILKKFSRSERKMTEEALVGLQAQIMEAQVVVACLRGRQLPFELERGMHWLISKIALTYLCGCGIFFIIHCLGSNASMSTVFTYSLAFLVENAIVCTARCTL